MPSPRVPPLYALLIDIRDRIASLEATVATQSEDIERIANYSRLHYESMFGADASSAGIWDGTDRWPDV